MRNHSYLADLEGPHGRSIVVRDETGRRVAVSFAGTSDGRTVYAYVDGVGFIGGWQYPHRRMPWSALADSINQGRIYERMEHLPNGRRRNG